MGIERSLEEVETEVENILTVKTQLDRAIKSKAMELRDKYGVENFKDEDLETLGQLTSLHFSGLAVHEHIQEMGIDMGGVESPGTIDECRDMQGYQLFFYLARRQNILEDGDINLYVAKALYDCARESAEFRQLKDNPCAHELTEKLLGETEALLSEPLQNQFGRAYQTYLLGAIEILRSNSLIHKYPKQEEMPGEIKEKITGHYKKAIRFLEESLYHSEDIAGARRKLLSAYNMTLKYFSSPEEKEVLKRKFERLDAKYPEYMEHRRELTARLKKGIEERKDLDKH